MCPFFSCLRSPKQDAKLTGREEARKAVVSPLAELPAPCSIQSAMPAWFKDTRLSLGGTKHQQPQQSLKSNRFSCPPPEHDALVLAGGSPPVPESLIKAWNTWSSGNTAENMSTACGTTASPVAKHTASLRRHTSFTLAPFYCIFRMD